MLMKGNGGGEREGGKEEEWRSREEEKEGTKDIFRKKSG